MEGKLEKKVGFFGTALLYNVSERTSVFGVGSVLLHSWLDQGPNKEGGL
jgi:hypothetical protein